MVLTSGTGNKRRGTGESQGGGGALFDVAFCRSFLQFYCLYGVACLGLFFPRSFELAYTTQASEFEDPFLAEHVESVAVQDIPDLVGLACLLACLL